MSAPFEGELDEIMAAMVYTEQTYLIPQFTDVTITSAIEEPDNFSNLQGPVIFRLPPSMKTTLWSHGGASQGAQHRIVWQFDIVYLTSPRTNNKLGKLSRLTGLIMKRAHFAYLKNPNLKGADGVATVHNIEFPEPHYTMGEWEFGGVKQFGAIQRLDAHQLIRET
jgi:hypothetical protein